MTRTCRSASSTLTNNPLPRSASGPGREQLSPIFSWHWHRREQQWSDSTSCSPNRIAHLPKRLLSDCRRHRDLPCSLPSKGSPPTMKRLPPPSKRPQACCRCPWVPGDQTRHSRQKLDLP